MEKKKIWPNHKWLIYHCLNSTL